MKYVLLVVAGLLFAVAGFVVGRAHPSPRHDDANEHFQQRLRCKAEAEKYLKESSDTDSDSGWILDKVEFSPVRHSCIGEFSSMRSGHGTTLQELETVDILTGENLFNGTCVDNDANSKLFCGNGRDIKLREEQDKALNQAMTKQD